MSFFPNWYSQNSIVLLYLDTAIFSVIYLVPALRSVSHSINKYNHGTIRAFILAPKVLIGDRWPMMTIPSSHPSTKTEREIEKKMQQDRMIKKIGKNKTPAYHWSVLSRLWCIWVILRCWGKLSLVEADFQSGSRVLKKVFWTFSYLYLWHTMWFHAEKLLKTLKFWKSLNSLCKSGSRPQKSPKKAQKRITQLRFTQFF